MQAGLNIAVLGGGESGVGAALLAHGKGHKVYLSDLKDLSPRYAFELREAGIEYEEGKHDLERIAKADLVIKSPGIPNSAPPAKVALESGVELISEVEFAYRYCQGTIVAVTGTNGKTTTAHLLQRVFTHAGLNSALVGNVGHSFARCIHEGDHEIYALEVSSFQLDDISQFRPHISIILNITPDHLDRYQNDFNRYLAAKFRIFENQRSDNYFIYNADCPNLKAQLPKASCSAQKLAISLNEILEEGAWQDAEGKIIINTQNSEAMKIEELSLEGQHNRYNSMAAGLAGRLLNIRKESIRESLSSFEAIEHRLEPVLQIYGINFINDSKATNVNSTWYALESMQAPTIWIAGGVDKGNDYGQLKSLVSEKVKAIICIGNDTRKLHQEFEGFTELVADASSIDEAVRMAYKLGDKNDNVLLSPACASFDWFENYEDRGRQFKQAVRKL